MQRTIMNARTVSIVKPFKVETKQGVDGPFESKSIMVRIAANRDYKRPRTENGKTTYEYPTDFWLAKFTGSTAEAFNKYCTDTKEDGKLISRHLLLEGAMENYIGVRKEHVSPLVDVKGELLQLEMDVELNERNTIFIVDSMTFLDSQPVKPQSTTGTVVTAAVVTPVSQSGTPVTQVVHPVTPTAQGATPVVIPSSPQPVAVPTAAQSVTVSVETPPVIDEGFSAEGGTAPF